jgi:hypothetical protein
MKNLILFFLLFSMPVFAQRYPSGGNASVGANGSAIPSSSDLAGAKDGSGNLQPLQIDGSGNLKVNVNASGGTLATNLTQVGGAAIALGQTVMANGVPVSLASNQSAIPVTESGTWTVQPGNTANTTPWLFSINAGGNTATVTGANALKVDGSAVTQPVSGTVTANIGTSGSLALDATVSSVQGTVGAGTAASKSTLVGGVFNTALPTLTNGQQAAIQLDSSGRQLIGAIPAGANTIGAVTQASGPWTQNLTQVGGSAVALGQTTMTSSIPVAIASNQSAVPASQSGNWSVRLQDGSGNTLNSTSSALNVSVQNASLAVTQSTSPWVTNQQGRAKANAPIRNDYSVSNATTSAYLQLVASTTSAASVICIFDSSGQDLVLAVGGSGSEVDQIEIFPGGNGCEPLSIASASRVSVKAKSANATSGVLLVNLYQ